MFNEPRTIFRSRRRRFARQLRHRSPGDMPGGDGGGGVSAPAPSGGGGGGGASGSAPAPSSQPSSGVAYAPPQPASYGQPDPNVPLSPSLQAALDGTGPGYEQNRQQVSQPSYQGGTQPQGGQQQPQVDPQWAAIRQSMGRFGVNIPDNMTPEQGYAALAQAYQGQTQRNYYADVGAAVAPHLTEFEQWRAWQQQQQQPQQPEPSGPWNPPQFDQQWAAVVEEDPNTGRLRSKPGYDPRYGTQAQAYADYMQDQQRSFWQDPPAFMEKMIAPYIQGQIQQHIQGFSSQYQEQAQASSLIQQNQKWLYQLDPRGEPVRDARGNRQLSVNGVRYSQYIEEAAKKFGMPTVQSQNDYALAMLQRDALYERYRNDLGGQQAGGGQAQPGQPPAQQPYGGRPSPQVPPGSFHQGGNVNGLQQMTPAYRQDVQPTNQPPAGMLSMHEMLRDGMRTNGVTDDEIRRDMARVG